HKSWYAQLEIGFGLRLLHPVTVWNNIKASMIGFMEEVRTKRLERERIDCIIKRQDILVPLLEAYRQTRTPEEVVPRNGDIMCMAPLDVVLESDRNSEVTAESFTDALAQLPELCIKWREDTDNFLLSLLLAPETDGCGKAKSQKAV